MNPAQLGTALRAHKIWLNSGGQRSKRADLSFLDLRGASLNGADLPRALFIGTNLRETSLNRAVLRGAFMPLCNLSGASLHDADLSDAKLMGAILCNTDMRSTGLEGADLSGAMLEGALLPEQPDQGKSRLMIVEVILIKRD